MDSGTASCGQCMLFILLIVSVSLYGTSFATVGPLEAGVLKNSVTQTLSEEVYTAGRYYTGPIRGFITYPTTLQTIEFSSSSGADSKKLSTATKEGQTVKLEITFQFRLMISKLPILYKQYEKNYKARYLTIINDAVKNLVSKRFSTVDYFTQREKIGNLIHIEVNQKLAAVYAVVEHCQLRNVDPNANKDRTVVDTLVLQEAVHTQQKKAEAVVVRSAMKVVQTAGLQETIIINANAQKNANLLLATANAQAINITLGTKVQMYKEMKDELNFSNENLLKFLFLESLRDLKSSDKIVAGLGSALFSQSF